MAIKIIKLKNTTLLILLMCSINILAQHEIKTLKKYAFNKCINYNYLKIDSTFYSKYQDASGIQLSVEGNFIENPELQTKIINYTIEKTGFYYLRKNDLHFDYGDRNTIVYDCLNFYESKELKIFIKKLDNITSKR